ncbi:MAG: hypothetical protein AB9917_14810 [Negativicutes bacterium]
MKMADSSQNSAKNIVGDIDQTLSDSMSTLNAEYPYATAARKREINRTIISISHQRTVLSTEQAEAIIAEGIISMDNLDRSIEKANQAIKNLETGNASNIGAILRIVGAVLDLGFAVIDKDSNDILVAITKLDEILSG